MSADNKITFQSFTERVAKRANVSDADADRYIHQLFKTAGDALEKGDEVQLYRFGRFTTVHFDERPGSNPQTGETITVPEHTRVDFQPYKALLLSVNWPFRHLRTRMLAEEENGRRPNAITWLLLLIALIALILIGINVNTWMFNRDSSVAAPADDPATMDAEPAATQAAPIVATTEPDTVTEAAEETMADAASETASDAAAEEATDTAADVPAGPIAAETFVVARGDTLWGISESQWDDTAWWPVIYAENRPDLAARNPDLIETGSSLRIPALEGGVDQPTDADLQLKAAAYRVVADDYTDLGHARASEYRAFVNRRFNDL